MTMASYVTWPSCSAQAVRSRRLHYCIISKCCLAVLLLSVSPAAQAAWCTISLVAPVNFGIYAPLSRTRADTTGTVTVRCRAAPSLGETVGYTLSLSSGGSGNPSDRKLSNGTSTLSQQLYIDAARSQVWGDGSSGTSVITQPAFYIAPASSVAHTHTIYARIPGHQGVRPGTYTDDVIVILTY